MAEIKRRQKEQKRREAAEAEAKAASQQEVEEVVEEPKPSKPSVFDGLLSQIAAESNRLTQEKKEADEARAAAAAQASAEPAQADSPYREKGAKKKKKARQQVEVDSESEDDRYRQMAQAVEQLQRDKVLEEARAAVAEAEKQSTGRRKKRKERRAAEAAKKAEEEAQRKAEITGVPVGVVQVTSGITVGELADALEVPGNEVVKRLFLLGTPLTLTQSMSDDLVELIAGDIGRESKTTAGGRCRSPSTMTRRTSSRVRPSSPSWVTSTTARPRSMPFVIRACSRPRPVASRRPSVHPWSGSTAIRSPSSTPRATRRLPPCAHVVRRSPISSSWSSPPMTASCRRPSRPSITPRQPMFPSSWPSTRSTSRAPIPDRVKSELAERGVVPEEWGGNNMFVEVSARQNLNIDELLETIILQAEVLELKANPDTTASGFVIEANLDKGRGPVATVIVQRYAVRGRRSRRGRCFGHVRALIDPKGNSVKEAKPADPVEILGLSSVPSAGDEFAVFENESEARSLAAERERKQRLAAQEAPRHMNLDDLFARIEANKHAELNLIVKADTQGSIEALRGALEKMDQSEVRINVIRAAVGGVTETDVNFAAASDAIIIGFGVRPQAGVRQAAEREKVDIRLYRVIYQAIEDINAARVGLLAPEEVEVDTGSATVRETFKMPKVGVIAGCIVTEGEIANTDHVRIVRDGVIVHDGSIMSMRHYRDDVSSVRSGTECGIGIEDFQDIKEGDVIEGYRIEQVARKE